MTGYALQEDLQKAADAGFDCHLAKPVDIDKLNSILAHLP
jgi:CheY-like chemotaxis protein